MSIDIYHFMSHVGIPWYELIGQGLSNFFSFSYRFWFKNKKKNLFTLYSTYSPKQEMEWEVRHNCWWQEADARSEQLFKLFVDASLWHLQRQLSISTFICFPSRQASFVICRNNNNIATRYTYTYILGIWFQHVNKC